MGLCSTHGPSCCLKLWMGGDSIIKQPMDKKLPSVAIQTILQSESIFFFLQTEYFSKSLFKLKRLNLTGCQELTTTKRHFLKFPKTTVFLLESKWVMPVSLTNLQSADQQKVSCLGMTRSTCAFQGRLQILQYSEEDRVGGKQCDK